MTSAMISTTLKSGDQMKVRMFEIFLSNVCFPFSPHFPGKVIIVAIMLCI